MRFETEDELLKFKQKAIGSKIDETASYSQAMEESQRKILEHHVRREMTRKRRLKLAQSIGKKDLDAKQMILDKQDKFRYVINQSCEILQQEKSLQDLTSEHGLKDVVAHMKQVQIASAEKQLKKKKAVALNKKPNQ